MPVIVEDSGFCVEKLGGMPGVHSAEWGENGGFAKGIAKIYQMLNGETSNAFFTSIIIFKNNEKEVIAKGDVFGKISPTPRGLNGFGFDSCFIPAGFEKTFAEMTIEEKSHLSHRKIALSNLIKIL
jgi:non-canonical purine NTP pyrophosphatase (RdgB/HAM1 family)